MVDLEPGVGDVDDAKIQPTRSRGRSPPLAPTSLFLTAAASQK